MGNISEKSQKLFEEYVKTDTLKLHCIEVEAIMKFLATELGENEEEWGCAGLLHDLDFDDPDYQDLKTHTKKTAEILRKEGYPEYLIQAILCHNEEGSGVERETNFDYCLAAADNVSGLIYAYGLMRHSLDGMEVSGLKKKMKDKRFAVAIRRDLIYDIEKIMPLDKFLEVSIKAMQSIKDKIGF